MSALDHEAGLVHRRIHHLVGIEAQRQIGQIEAVRLHHPDREQRVFELRALRVQVVAAQTHRQRTVFGPDRTHRVQRLEQEARAVGHAAAVLVGALVGQRRKEAGAEVAMGKVQFQPLVPGVARPHGRVRI
ncbi:MAG: hypothetical protein KA169_02085 [Burkholderiaceae bacterium]|nr:hypothetical protein [Burkholderiaceae bacterium]